MMTPKMVAHFRRSVSFSNTPSPPPPPSATTSKTTAKRIHFRSTSLPTRSHPILFQLKFHLNQLKSQWPASEPVPESINSSRITDALLRLRIILECLDDLLDLAPSRDSLRRHPEWVEKVLEDFLVMVDVYGTFQMQISTLKQCNVAAQLASRRKDGLKTAVCLKGLKKSGREIFKLMPFLQEIREHRADLTPLDHDQNPDIDLVEVIKGVLEVIIMISEAVFGGISVSLETPKTSWIMGLKKPKREKGIKEVENGISSLRNYKDEILNKKMMKEMEECIEGIESGSERVFRSLINTRVSLLNILTQ